MVAYRTFKNCNHNHILHWAGYLELCYSYIHAANTENSFIRHSDTQKKRLHQQSLLHDGSEQSDTGICHLIILFSTSSVSGTSERMQRLSPPTDHSAV